MRSNAESPLTSATSTQRLKLAIRGAVQGVGFRPFVHRLAGELHLTGWVNNSTQGVSIEVEGLRNELEKFFVRLETEKPPRSFIQSLESSWLDPIGSKAFEIRPSEAGGSKTALVLPDIATCPDCLREVFDPANRRYNYPFINCTNCGPRFSIIESLPYDRANTSMKSFTMCPQCLAEYTDPNDRRFHAQPNACPVCGPQLELWNSEGEALSKRHEALLVAAEALRSGQIVAVKGIGGFHLMVAAHDDAAVDRLRARKDREEKPFALMFPSMEIAKSDCEISSLEDRLLRSPECPIVLLRRRPTQKTDHFYPLSPSIAPNNPYLGAMLPCAPLHHLLLAELGFPVIATSGNLSDEPICTDEQEALARLRGIADLFLVHNRPIVRHVDDSIARIMLGRELVLRRARGYAPLPISIEPRNFHSESQPVLAVGAHLKNAIALAVGPQVFISQHLGDLESEQSYTAFHDVITDFQNLYEAKPATVAADFHPDYPSARFAKDLAARPGGPRLIGVQHHVAHVLSCLAENELEVPVLGVSWDGTGYGLDGTIWGGEFFLVTDQDVQRVAHLRPFRLPGGDKAVKEPRRTALGLLHEIFGHELFQQQDLAPLIAFSASELANLKTMLARGLNSPVTSSVGRLFDAIASLVGLRQQIRFEGQAAMELEFALKGVATEEHYPFLITGGSPLILDWAPAIQAILTDIQDSLPLGMISAKFHNGLVEALLLVARQLNQPRVVMSGGCFQNSYLTERAVHRLQQENFRPYWHQRVPPNDGGIALGQIVAAMRTSGGNQIQTTS